MKVLLCIDKFKSSISSIEMNNLVKKDLELSKFQAEIEVQGIADGGDGSLEILNYFIDAIKITIDSFDPLGRDQQAEYLLEKEVAHIELATCSGLALLREDEFDPYLTSTYGTGVVIRDAIERGAKVINLYLGGSATIDGGTGILHALGIGFFAENHRMLFPNGENIQEIVELDLSNLNRLRKIKFNLICDVENPICGENGASYSFGPQKGLLDDSDLEYLENSMDYFCELCSEELFVDVRSLKSGGAAGGVAAGLFAFLGAKIYSGSSFFLEKLGLIQKIELADLIITGEGKLDKQSWQGKLIGHIFTLCNEMGKDCKLICGTVDPLVLEGDLINTDNVFTVLEHASSLKESIENVEHLIPSVVEKVVQSIDEKSL